MADETEMMRLKDDALDEGGNYYKRNDAIEALGKIGGKSAVLILIDVLSHPDEQARSLAAKELGNIGDRTAVRPLINALSSMPWDIYIVDALGKLGDTSAVPSLLKALSAPNDEMRFRAAGWLGKIGDKSAIPALVNALTDSNDAVGRNAAWSLGQIGDASVLPSLIKVLLDPVNQASGGSGFLGNVDAAIVKFGDQTTLSFLIQIYSRPALPDSIECGVRSVLLGLGQKLKIRSLNESYLFELGRKSRPSKYADNHQIMSPLTSQYLQYKGWEQWMNRH